LARKLYITRRNERRGERRRGVEKRGRGRKRLAGRSGDIIHRGGEKWEKEDEGEGM